MSGRPSIGKLILLTVSGLALAGFSCLGALSGGQGALVVGGTGFVAGLILLIVSLLRLVYYVLVWVIDRFAPPQPPAAAEAQAPAPPDSPSSEGGEPPQTPRE